MYKRQVSDSVQLEMQLSADGTNYDTTNGNYHEGGTDRTGMSISTPTIGGASGEVMGVSMVSNLYNVSSTAIQTALTSRGGGQDANGNFSNSSRASSYVSSTAAHTAIKILFTSGNIESGEITMFGIVNS